MNYDRELLHAPEGVDAGGSGENSPPSGGTGDPGTGPSGAAANPGPSGGGAQPDGSGGSWFDKLTPEDRTWAESKGYKADTDPSVVASSYRNLEKMMGADKAGRTVLLPKDAEDKQAIDAIFTKLGRPEKSDGYEITLPEGADPTFSNVAREAFLKANLTKDQAKQMTDWYQGMELDMVKQGQDFVKQDEEALRKDWGNDFDKNRETARAATKAAGMTDEDVNKMVGAIGPSKASKILEFFGRNYTEASPPGQEGRTAPGFSNMTPASASARIDQLRADPNFMARYGSNDPNIREAAMKEMDDLSRLAVNTKRM